ncbi:hypothetical protein RA955_11760 [Geobacillus proteiniphilus]|uniref:DegV family protein n=1 Tax=Geobacillus proteiniphilus TaxID=860353 RepID=A0A1Q5T1G8_9BACL|nr:MULTISPECIES: hypothetical protein [Geobacillus]OKO94117.1 hypothetical protein BRO54_1732 [Geobacillus proteiniphilus]OPX02261.1 hypothetical protein B1A75_13685 [Geobacillus sp. LEMMY01]WMJ15464.1 hypothetical protein RA955_11760 [Geobacillus proteiniphilus]
MKNVKIVTDSTADVPAAVPAEMVSSMIGHTRVETTPVISIHTGPGALALMYYTEEPDRE